METDTFTYNSDFNLDFRLILFKHLSHFLTKKKMPQLGVTTNIHVIISLDSYLDPPEISDDKCQTNCNEKHREQFLNFS